MRRVDLCKQLASQSTTLLIGLASRAFRNSTDSFVVIQVVRPVNFEPSCGCRPGRSKALRTCPSKPDFHAICHLLPCFLYESKSIIENRVYQESCCLHKNMV